jgi:hypothetical protein
MALCDEIIPPQTVTPNKKNQHAQRSTQQCMYSNLLKRHANKLFKWLHTANLHEMQDILVSGFSGWLRAKMAD